MICEIAHAHGVPCTAEASFMMTFAPTCKHPTRTLLVCADDVINTRHGSTWCAPCNAPVMVSDPVSLSLTTARENFR